MKIIFAYRSGKICLNTKRKEKTMTKQTETEKKTKVDYYVHAVVQNGRGDKIGSSIGVAFNNKSGNGFTAYLDATPIPIDGQIKLVGLIPNQK